MRPLLHPALVNGRFGDPAIYIETLFEKHAILFDLGDIHALSPRKIGRIEHIFVSHTHIDHFVGFDRLLRVLVGREKKINLYGPDGFIDRVRHKLHAYQWNLVDRYLCDLIFIVTELRVSGVSRTVRFRLKNAFADEELGQHHVTDNILCCEPTFHVSATILEHRTPCLAYLIEETAHVNIWKNKLVQLGLPVGPWLRDLKRAVVETQPNEYTIRIRGQSATTGVCEMSLGALREVLTVVAGQKIGYVTDVADTVANREAIIRLVRGSDLLFIEAAFAEADFVLAAERAHLTTRAAGHIARMAGARCVEPFHFSPRYKGQEARMLAEVMAAFSPEAEPS